MTLTDHLKVISANSKLPLQCPGNAAEQAHIAFDNNCSQQPSTLTHDQVLSGSDQQSYNLLVCQPAEMSCKVSA